MFSRLFLTAAPAVCAFAAIASPALAQETASPWSGWYVGANLGGSWGDVSTNTTASPGNGAVVIPPALIAEISRTGSGSNNNTGFTGGLEGGYNFLSNGWLFGLETDYDFFDTKQSRANSFQANLLPPSTAILEQRVKTDWLWTLRPRIGYAFGPWLVYGTGGLAMTNIKYDMNYSDTRSPPGLASMSTSDTKTGWTLGLGAGYAASPHWSLKGEWLYADFGSINGTAATSDGFATFNNTAKVRSNILRLGVDYTF
jgi:outer membrane immunogenic protein